MAAQNMTNDNMLNAQPCSTMPSAMVADCSTVAYFQFSTDVRITIPLQQVPFGSGVLRLLEQVNLHFVELPGNKKQKKMNKTRQRQKHAFTPQETFPESHLELHIMTHDSSEMKYRYTHSVHAYCPVLELELSLVAVLCTCRRRISSADSPSDCSISNPDRHNLNQGQSTITSFNLHLRSTANCLKVLKKYSLSRSRSLSQPAANEKMSQVLSLQGFQPQSLEPPSTSNCP